MAESGTEGSWWNGWIQAAKEKSASAYEFVKKDLVEFKSTMQTDTVKVASEVKNKMSQESAMAATEKAKQGVTQLLGGISKALTVEAEDKTPPRKANSQSRHIFDRAKARINAVQVDPDTYCKEPSGAKEDFEKWLTTFNLDEQKGKISELLVINVEVRALYTQLVPSQVSHADYWQRYFYKMHQLEQDEQRKAALMKRADDVQHQVDWDDDDDWGDLEGPASPPRSSGMMLAAEALERTHAQDNNQQETVEDKTKTIATNSDERHELSDSSDKECPKDVEDNDKDLVTDNKQTTETTVIDSSIKADSVEEKVETVTSPGDDSSLSISSITDNMKTLESSTDTLTLVSPLEEVTNVPVVNEEVSTVPSSADKLPEPECSSSEHSSPVESDADSLHSAEIKKITEESEKNKEIQTKIKGDLVVVGSATGSDLATPSSSSSSNKETEDDWEKEFEVSDEDLKLAQHSNIKPTTEVPNEDMEDDWESWD